MGSWFGRKVLLCTHTEEEATVVRNRAAPLHYRSAGDNVPYRLCSSSSSPPSCERMCRSRTESTRVRKNGTITKHPWGGIAFSIANLRTKSCSFSADNHLARLTALVWTPTSVMRIFQEYSEKWEGHERYLPISLLTHQEKRLHPKRTESFCSVHHGWFSS